MGGVRPHGQPARDMRDTEKPTSGALGPTGHPQSLGPCPMGPTSLLADGQPLHSPSGPSLAPACRAGTSEGSGCRGWRGLGTLQWTRKLGHGEGHAWVGTCVGVSGGPQPGSQWADLAEPLTASPRAVTANSSRLSLSLVLAIIVSALEQVSEKSGPVPPPCPLMEGL